VDVSPGLVDLHTWRTSWSAAARLAANAVLADAPEPPVKVRTAPAVLGTLRRARTGGWQ
jgi:hypothetical protein